MDYFIFVWKKKHTDFIDRQWRRWPIPRKLSNDKLFDIASVSMVIVIWSRCTLKSISICNTEWPNCYAFHYTDRNSIEWLAKSRSLFWMIFYRVPFVLSLSIYSSFLHGYQQTVPRFPICKQLCEPYALQVWTQIKSTYENNEKKKHGIYKLYA